MSSADQTSRLVALEILVAIMQSHDSYDDAVLKSQRFSKLAERDRHFVHLLVFTTLRRMGQIDEVLRQFMQKPLRGTLFHVKHILQLGAAQLLFLDTQPHAAVNTSVEIAEIRGFGSMKGLVNAVLRKVSSQGKGLLLGQDAGRLNTPKWMWDAWVQTYHDSTAARIAEAHMMEAPLDICVKSDPEGWAEKLGGTLLSTGSIRLNSAAGVSALPGYEDGEWWVQDAAAALPVLLLGDVRGKRVVDLCAAPGGKTAQLAAAGAEVLAVDKSVKRLKILKSNMKRLKLSVDVVEADALNWRTPSPADAVLLDAPCSATGTIRRHPDLPRIKRPADIADLQELQRKMLAHAVGMVKPGGTLVYAVCSLQPEEGERQIEAFLKTHPNFKKVPVKPEEIGGLEGCITSAGFLRTLPCHMADSGGMDGFFAARVVRE